MAFFRRHAIADFILTILSGSLTSNSLVGCLQAETDVQVTLNLDGQRTLRC